MPGPWRPTVATFDGFGIGRGTEPTDPLVARNLRSGEFRWQYSTDGLAILALDEGGAGVTEANGSYKTLDGTGAVDTVKQLNHAAGPYAYGRLHVRDGFNALSAVPWGPVDDATEFAQTLNGNIEQSSNAYGLFAESYHATGFEGTGWQHIGLRVAPRRQRHWLATPNQYHFYFTTKPEKFGDLKFFTVGAQPTGVVPCVLEGYLNAYINRPNDVHFVKINTERVKVPDSDIDSKTLAIFQKMENFPNDTLDYECTPTWFSDGYNSDSWLHGIFIAAGLPDLVMPYDENGEVRWQYDGWEKPVPVQYFNPQQ